MRGGFQEEAPWVKILALGFGDTTGVVHSTLGDAGCTGRTPHLWSQGCFYLKNLLFLNVDLDWVVVEKDVHLGASGTPVDVSGTDIDCWIM